MQPMYTRKTNQQIAEKLGHMSLYSLADPSSPPTPVLVRDNELVRQIMADKNTFMAPYGVCLACLFPNKRDFSKYMMAGNATQHTAQLVGDTLYGSKSLKSSLGRFFSSFSANKLKAESLELGIKGLYQIDILRE
jgi:hypothetical protein